MVGNIQGGLASSCVLTCMLFAAISGRRWPRPSRSARS
ncbi:hypothetical protein FLP41_08110 [Paracoccus marcusii]|nr:hypothetical protein FLP41_08110 [Paracoccus marcusii]